MHDALLDNIAALLSRERNRPVFIVIDGPAGAGKTTLARSIVDHFAMGEVIHCDDLYHGWEDALTSTLEEHFQEWILTPLRAGAMPVTENLIGIRIHISNVYRCLPPPCSSLRGGRCPRNRH